MTLDKELKAELKLALFEMHMQMLSQTARAAGVNTAAADKAAKAIVDYYREQLNAHRSNE